MVFEYLNQVIFVEEENEELPGELKHARWVESPCDSIVRMAIIDTS